MKKIALLIVLLGAAFAGKGQNLVPNGDFEQYLGCPTDIAQIDSLLFWINPALWPGPGGTPDYFNQCSNLIVGVPTNSFGYQNAQSGMGYCGLITWLNSPDSNYREYIETPLTSPLISNQCYQFNMYACLAEQSNFTSGNIQVYFSDTLISGINNYLTLSFVPQISNASGIINDTLNWTLISGNYQATGGESYLLIGNFLTDAYTTTQITGFGTFGEVYFYIDDVCLTTCGSSCINTNTVQEQNQNTAINIYPNPAKDELTINLPGFKNLEDLKTEITITDILGKEIYRNQITSSNFQFQVSNFQPGIYFIEINNGKNIFRKKFLKE